MEEQTNKPSKGTWDRLGNEETGNKISFDINIPQKVTFISNIPEELESVDGGVYYKFNVKQEDEEKYFTTSAWTLLGALKNLTPLKDKCVIITKKLEKGKQKFDVVVA